MINKIIFNAFFSQNDKFRSIKTDSIIIKNLLENANVKKLLNLLDFEQINDKLILSEKNKNRLITTAKLAIDKIEGFLNQKEKKIERKMDLEEREINVFDLKEFNEMRKREVLLNDIPSDLESDETIGQQTNSDTSKGDDSLIINVYNQRKTNLEELYPKRFKRRKNQELYDENLKINLFIEFNKDGKVVKVKVNVKENLKEILKVLKNEVIEDGVNINDREIKIFGNGTRLKINSSLHFQNILTNSKLLFIYKHEVIKKDLKSYEIKNPENTHFFNSNENLEEKSITSDSTDDSKIDKIVDEFFEKNKF